MYHEVKKNFFLLNTGSLKVYELKYFHKTNGGMENLLRNRHDQNSLFVLT